MPRQIKTGAPRQAQHRRRKKNEREGITNSSAQVARESEIQDRRLELKPGKPSRNALLQRILEQHSEILDALNDGISLYDLGGTLIGVNDAFVRMYGYTAKNELIGRKGIDLVAEQDRARMLDSARQVLESGRHTQAEYTFVRNDGSQFLGEVSLCWIRDANENPIGFAGISRDTTAQKQAEQALKTSQEYAKNIIDSSLDMIIAVDNDRRITEFNRAAERVLGYRREQVLGQNIRFLYADSNESQSVNQTTLSEGQSVQQILNRSKDGRVFPALLSASVLRDSTGKAIGFMGISRDISESIKAQEEQKRLFEEVRLGRERMKALSKRLLEIQEVERREIARELHDEIGQAITGVQINLQMIEPRLSDAAARTRLEDTLTTVERVLQQVRSMSLELRPSMLDDFGLVPAARWYLERQAQRSGLNIRFTATPLSRRPAGEIETVCYRVIQEAITNVIRHAHATEALVDLAQAGDELHLTIQDNGIGMDLPKVIEQATRGTSMGLLGLRERVMLLGGQVEMYSAPAEGTRIQIQVAFEPYKPLKERRSHRRKE